MTKTILITGCSSGFGYTTSKYLTNQGYRVISTVRSLSDLKVLPNTVQLDVSWSQAKIDKVVKEVVAKYGQIDCLINNAGYGYQGRVEDAEEEEVRKQIETNFIGTFKMIKSVLPYMKKQKNGKIINISSVLGLVSLPKYGIYSASKFAVEAMSRALRIELATDNIKVVVINPGSFKTDFNKKSVFNKKPNFPVVGYGEEPIKFAKLIEKILKTKNPKRNYIVGKEKIAIELLKSLPLVISDQIFKRIDQ